ncbi:MAG: patatin-like phospholipase family protein [Acidobacteriaceae bacterium]
MKTKLLGPLLQRCVALFLMGCFVSTALSANAVATEIAKPRPRIGLALGGGGALGLAHIGVLQWFEEHHIPVDMIAGTSMGAIIGGLYAAGYSPEQMERLTSQSVLGSVFRINADYQSLNYRRRQDRRELPNAITVGLRQGIATRNAVLTDKGLNAFLDSLFLNYGNNTNFDSLPIPFRCLATDITTAKPVTFSSGSLPEAIRASVSLPGIFSPVEKDGHSYVDGGVLENLPTQTLRAMHADVVIAVSLPLAPASSSDTASILSVVQRSFGVAIEQNEEASRKLADVVLEPQTQQYTSLDYVDSAKLIQAGYAAAEAMRAQLLPYALNDAEWKEYLRERESRKPPSDGKIQQVKVEAPDAGVAAAAKRTFAPLVGQPIQPPAIERRLDQIRGDGRYNADYGVSYPHGSNENPSLLIHVRNEKYGPPYLLVGANVFAESGGVTRGTLDMILQNQDLGGYGSELRSTLKVGFLTQLSSEYYRKLTAGGLFVAPHVNLLRQPVYIYANQRRIAERLDQNVGGGLDLGYTFNQKSELRLGWQTGIERWHTEVGSDGKPDFSGTAQAGVLRFHYDGQDRALVPTYGQQFTFKAGYLFHTADTRNTPFAELRASHFSTYKKKNIFAFSVAGGTMFHRNVADPFKFTLGGPMRLGASAVDEYRGTDYFYLSPSYLRRIASLPAPLGQHIYVVFSFEAGQMHDPGLPTILRQDGYLGIVAETPLGAITFGPAIGDDGHRKLVFTLGKLF